MDYVDFRADQLAELSDGEYDSEPRIQYMEAVCNALIDSGKLLDYEFLVFDGIGSRGRRLAVDGYSFEEDDGTLNLFSCQFLGDEEMQTITKTDIEKICLRTRNFLEACLDGTILNYANHDDECLIQSLSTIIELGNKIQRVIINIITDAVRSDRDIKITLDDVDDITCQTLLWDIKSYYDLLLSDPEKDKITIEFSDFGYEFGIKCIQAQEIGSDQTYDAYLCIMPGKLLSDLYTKYGARLLESNVRSFLSMKKKVNAGMRETILNAPDMFFAYNNGLSTTSRGIHLVKNENGYSILSIDDLQIVNGGQTTALINYLDRSPNYDPELDAVFVPMKLCVIKDDAAPDFVPNISQFSNSQTAVSSADFFSNSQFNIKLEKISRRLEAPPGPGSVIQTKWFYERTAGSYVQAQAFMSRSEMKNFQRTNPKNQRITKTELAKYRNTYDKIPHIVSKGTSASISEFIKKAKKLWGDEDSSSLSLPGAKVNDNYYKDSVAIAIMFKDLEKSISNKELAPWYNSGYRANLVTYSIAKLVDVLDEMEKSVNLDIIWRNQSISGPLRTQLLIIAEKTLQTIQDPSRKIDDVREWCKKEGCWQSIQRMKIELIDLGNAITSKKAKNLYVRRAARDERVRSIDTLKADIVNKGDEYWGTAVEWGLEREILSRQESEILSVAANMHKVGRPPSDSQTKRIGEIYEKLISHGFNP